MAAHRRVIINVHNLEDGAMELKLTSQIFEEGGVYVSYTPELDISSCGKSVDEAKKNLVEAVEGFLEEAARMGTLAQILEEAGFIREGEEWRPPEAMIIEKISLPVPNVNV